MTKQELIDAGWKPKTCKIGTLYFKHGFFCSFKDENTVKVYSITDDLNPICVTSELEVVNDAEKYFYKDQVKRLKMKYLSAKEFYENKYNEKLDI